MYGLQFFLLCDNKQNQLCNLLKTPHVKTEHINTQIKRNVTRTVNTSRLLSGPQTAAYNDKANKHTDQEKCDKNSQHIKVAPVSYTHLTLPTKRIV